MTPWLNDPDVRLYHGDALEVLRQLPSASVHMCATSPPFYGLRDYGTGTWEGGDEACDHMPEAPEPILYDNGQGQAYATNNQNWNKKGRQHQGNECPKCGARRVDRQIGLEETPDQWVERLVSVFREVRRVLRDDGTLWVEIGDSYCSSAAGNVIGATSGLAGVDSPKYRETLAEYAKGTDKTKIPGVKPKDLLGQPWLLAFALRADGWYLRSEIIWARPNPMPESVTDRPTKSHSTVFLLSKRPRYFYDADAIREDFTAGTVERFGKNNALAGNTPKSLAAEEQHWGKGRRSAMSHVYLDTRPQSETLDGSDGESPRGPDGRRVTAVKGAENSEQHRDGERWPNPSGANARSVWTVPTEPTPFAHFATWPRKLVARMILAGTSERGCCPECGAPWVRNVERELHDTEGYGAARKDHHAATHGSQSMIRNGQGRAGDPVSRTLGWSPSCAHDHTPAPCTVLDPFAGSGTTLLVARQHGRHSIGIELNEDYCRLVADRTRQQSLLAEGAA